MTYIYINPVVAVILGAVILGEAVTLRTLAATAVILLGVLLVQLSRQRVAVPVSTGRKPRRVGT